MTETLSDILDTKYVVKLVEQSWVDNEYGDWQEGQTKIIKEFVNEHDAKGFVGLCNSKIPETQRKYRGKISYVIVPMYLRIKTTKVTEWTTEGRTQRQIDKAEKDFMKMFFRPKDNTYVG